MKLRQRFLRALKAFNSKSDRETIEMNKLLDFLGIDRDTDQKVLSEATYFACLKVLSEAIGKLPLKLLQYNDKNGTRVARDHYLYRIVGDRPNRYMTASSFWSTVEYNRNHYGNGYVWIQGGGSTTTLWLLPSNQVEMWYDDACILSNVPDIFYLYSSGGKVYRLGSEEVIHVKSSNTLDGIVGISVQDQLKLTIGGNLKAQNMINKMYDSGFTAKAVLQYTGSLSDENAKTFVKGIEDYAKGKMKDSGVENIIPIPLGASLQPLNVKLADNQFIEVKQYTSLQIASAFGIKPYQIGDYTKSSYASAEAQQLSFYVDTLLYIVKQYEEEISYKLLSAEEIADGYYFKFNIDVILRADFASKITSLSTAVNSFLMTPNEARAKLDLESKEGGDRLLGNGSSIPVDCTGSQYTDDVTESNPVEEETVESTPDEIISIAQAIRDGSITYDQAVAIIRVTIGYEDAIARELLGNPEDYEPEEVPEQLQDPDDNEENTEEDPTTEEESDETEETEDEDTDSDNS